MNLAWEAPAYKTIWEEFRMMQMICSPSKYIQGGGEISKLGLYCS
ncbi:hypothetical protein [Paenibacillus sp. S150]|nr:hypothetical protein [Paenibacillus sp. S150]